MSPTTLKVKKNSISLPADWVKTYEADEVAAVSMGDVLVLRPVKMVNNKLGNKDVSQEDFERGMKSLAQALKLKLQGRKLPSLDEQFEDLHNY